MPRLKRPTMRSILRWTIVPVVSFVLVVAVAMACAVWSPLPDMYPYIRPQFYNEESVPEPRRRFDGAYIDGAGSWAFSTWGFSTTFCAVMAVPLADREMKSEVQIYTRDFAIAGFPFRCMRWSAGREREVPRSSVWISGIETRRTFWLGQATRRIPLRPEPVGMVLNVLIYSAAIVLPRYAWRRAVVLRRKRRNLCVKCGYPMGDFAVCPESGESIESS